MGVHYKIRCPSGHYHESRALAAEIDRAGQWLAGVNEYVDASDTLNIHKEIKYIDAYWLNDSEPVFPVLPAGYSWEKLS